MLKTRIDLTPTTGYSTYFTSLDPRGVHTQQTTGNHQGDARVRSKLLNVPEHHHHNHGKTKHTFTAVTIVLSIQKTILEFQHD